VRVCVCEREIDLLIHLEIHLEKIKPYAI